MKKLVFALLLCIATSFVVQAQTKEETVTWLTEKMMKPGFFELYRARGNNATAKIISVRFDDNYLIIEGTLNYNDLKYVSYGDKIRSYEDRFTYSINLSKLTDAVFGYHNSIATDGNAIREYLYAEEWGYKYGDWTLLEFNTTNIYTYSTGKIGVVSNIEPDILERFKKAIKHYQTLMTVKKSTETF